MTEFEMVVAGLRHCAHEAVCDACPAGEMCRLQSAGKERMPHVLAADMLVQMRPVYLDAMQGMDPLTVNQYQAAAARTINPDLSERDTLINGVMGLCGEAGEAIDIVKKHIAQGHALDREKLIKELGDVAWYLAETATALRVPLSEVLLRNIKKLTARYPVGFAAEKSVHRAPGDD